MNPTALPAADPLSLTFWTIAACFVLAGAVKGVVGMGLPTVAMGLLGSFLPPLQAAALLLLPSAVTNVWQMVAGGALAALWRRLAGLQVAAFAGTLLSPIGLSTLDPRWGAADLGGALVVYGALGLASIRLQVPPRWEPVASPLVGLLTGVVSAATGVFVFPAVPYLQGLGLPKQVLVQALGLSFTVSTVALALRLGWDGGLATTGSATGWWLVLPLAAALLGMFAGQALRDRVGEATFKRLFFVGMLLVGAHLVARAVLR